MLDKNEIKCNSHFVLEFALVYVPFIHKDVTSSN